MSYFRTRYEIANSYTAEEMRKIAPSATRSMCAMR